MFKVVAGRVLVKDIGADDFGMELPDSFEAGGIGLGVVAMKVIAIGEGEFDHAGFIEHPEKFSTEWADERSVKSGLGFTTSFAN